MAYVGRKSDNIDFVLSLGKQDEKFDRELKEHAGRALSNYGIDLTDSEVREVEEVLAKVN